VKTTKKEWVRIILCIILLPSVLIGLMVLLSKCSMPEPEPKKDNVIVWAIKEQREENKRAEEALYTENKYKQEYPARWVINNGFFTYDIYYAYQWSCTSSIVEGSDKPILVVCKTLDGTNMYTTNAKKFSYTETPDYDLITK